MGDKRAAYLLEDLQRECRAFRDERDWAQFHDPKSLILALVGEVGELAELFQWVPSHEAAARFREGRAHERVGEEMSDVLIYLLSLAEVLDIDLLTAARAKLAQSRLRFPVAEVVSVAPEKA
jgi:NTP pyrophosphatase (non-canonical NTP hydrolase)